MMEFIRNIVIGTAPSNPGPGTQVSMQAEVLETGDGQREDKQVSYGFVAKQGRRGNMEDFTFAQFKRCRNGEQYGFFGVFDGHGGPAAASFVKDNLFVKLESESNFPDDMPTALTNAFQGTDQDYLNKGNDNDGCTGVVAVVKDRQVWIAHVGDSRAVLIKPSGQAEALSDDHKPNREAERHRIEREGGVVIWAGTWRVGGVLAVSRAFGDRPLKRYVIATPDVKQQTIASGESIILASDGLWDVIENQVRCCMLSDTAFVYNTDAALHRDSLSDIGAVLNCAAIKEAAMVAQEQHKPDAKELAQQLVHEAYARGSADNISCVVIHFSAS